MYINNKRSKHKSLEMNQKRTKQFIMIFNVKYEVYVNYVFCKLCKNRIYVKNVNYAKYD